MQRIADYEAFVAAIDLGSLTAASRHLGRTLQSVSRSLAALEAELGVELIRRTTRRSHPTEAGTILHRRVKNALAEIAAARIEAARRRFEPAGLLRVTCPSGFAETYVVPAVTSFLRAHAGVGVEVDTVDRHFDGLEDGVDVAILVGTLRDSALKSKQLAAMRRVFFASPGYLDRRGVPAHPEDLRRHDCIVRTMRQGGHVWPYRDGGEVRTVEVNGRYRANSGGAISEGAIQGLGIGLAPLSRVRSALQDGALRTVLDPYAPPPIPIQAVWSGARALPAKTRLFVDFLSQHLRAAGL